MKKSKLQQIKDDLASGKRHRKSDAINIIKQFKDGLPKSFSLEEKIEIISKMMVLNTKELTPVWVELLQCVEESITSEVRKQIDQLLTIEERFEFLEILIADQNLHNQALELVATWGSTTYGDLVILILKSDKDELVEKAVKILSNINFVAYVSKFIPLIHHPNDDIRLCVAETIAASRNENIPFYFYERCLFDDVREIRQAALVGGVNLPSKKWIHPLKKFIKERNEVDDLEKAIRILGSINTKKVIQPIIDCLKTTQNQSMRWACIQALDEVDIDMRLDYYEKALAKLEHIEWPQIIELLGHCEGKKTYQILKKLLNESDEPGLRSLIIGAMGTSGFPEAEKDLIAMMQSGLAETYAAAAALKSLVKDKVMGHFEDFLRKKDLDEVVKQVIVQHIGESAGVLDIPRSLTKIVESNFKSKNENMRYISLITIGHIASHKSIDALLAIYRKPWVERFMTEYDGTLDKCCRGKISPLLKRMEKQGPDSETFEIAREYLNRHAMIMDEYDLNILNTSNKFEGWNWDEELLGCIKQTHEHDKSFVWRQFSRDNLPEKLCCFIANGFDAANPYAREIVDTSILIKCFG